MQKVFIGFALAALWLAGAGCATQAPQAVILGRETVHADAAEKITRATVKLAHEVTILLRPPSKAGYGWQIAQHNSFTLRQTAEIMTNPAGETSVTFLTLRPGLTRILFTLVPVNRPTEAEPVDVEEVQLQIEG